MIEVTRHKEDEVIAEIENFAELPDAPPANGAGAGLRFVYCARSIDLF